MTHLRIAAAAALLAAPAFAASFAEVDADADGAVSLSEAQAAMPDLSVDDFTVADVNGDGALSETEFAVLPQG